MNISNITVIYYNYNITHTHTQLCTNITIIYSVIKKNRREKCDARECKKCEKRYLSFFTSVSLPGYFLGYCMLNL